LYGQIGGAVVLVDDGVYFDDFEAEHAAVVGEDLHGEVGFAVGCAAADRGSDAGCILGIDPVHIERDVIAGCTAPRCPESFLHDGSHAALVDVAHRVDLADASLANVGTLGGIDVPDAYQDCVLRRDLGGIAQHICQLFGAHAKECCLSHPVDIATRRSIGGIDVRVGIDPDDADFLVLPAVKVGYAGDRTCRDGMIAAEHEGCHPLFQRPGHSLCCPCTDLRDLFQITRVRASEVLGFGNIDGHISTVFHVVAESLQAGFKSSHPHCGGTHIHATPARAHVEGDP